MIYLDRGPIVFTDIDGTLVDEIPVSNMYTITFKHPYQDREVHVLPNLRNIDLLKNWKARGRTVIAWSAAGHAWAFSVINALGLEDHVDIVMEKPIAYLDDLEAEMWMGQRVWLNDGFND